MSRTYIRFTPRQRAEHAVMMTVFTLLVITGLPQKFFEASLSVWVLDLVGGVDRARWIHRACGLVFVGLAVFHVGSALADVVRGRSSLSMVPTRKDFTDAVVTLRYYLGVSNEQTKFDRFDYRQKFEYWGLILGSVVVIVTGLILLWPVTVAQYLPGEVIPSREFYDYAAKYIDDDSRLLIPAPLNAEQTAEVQRLAVAAFLAIDGAGLARVDFLLDRQSGQLYLNEVNTLPGFTSISMYPKLWAASGLPFESLVDRLVELALERHQDKSRNETSFS